MALLFSFSLALQTPWALASSFSFMIIFTDGRTPWASDQLVARPLPKHRTTQTQNKRIQTPHVLDRAATMTGRFTNTMHKINYRCTLSRNFLNY
jgi:hypothetical protein